MRCASKVYVIELRPGGGWSPQAHKSGHSYAVMTQQPMQHASSGWAYKAARRAAGTAGTPHVKL